MNKLFLWVIIAVLVAAGIFWLTRNGDDRALSPTNTPLPTISGSPAPSPTTSPNDGKGSESGSIKAFTITGTSFKFDVKEIRVKEGDMVRITFKNAQGLHDWVVDAFAARTRQLQAGQEETIQFVANKKGTFEYYCSVGNHRQQGMVGKLIVE